MKRTRIAKTSPDLRGDREKKRWIPLLSLAGAATAVAIVGAGISTVQTIDAPAAAGSAAMAPQAGNPGKTPSGQALAKDKRNPAVILGGRPEKSLADAGAEATDGRASNGKETGNRPDRASGLTERGPVDPQQVLTDVSEGLGGCLVEYGADGQCLPGVPPSMGAHLKHMKEAGQDPATMPHSWSCREARTYFAEGLPLRQAGVDPQRLDTNGDGTACGIND